MVCQTPYDEVPYRSYPIPWTAPERLALASMIHGGPRVRLDEYCVLELGCGDGTNLIPMAYYRRHGMFVGVDSASGQIARARAKQAQLGLDNLVFIASDFESVEAQLTGLFDFVIGHGVFSWVASNTRDAILELCKARLKPGGILYLNYNAKPGWNVRGLIRQFLLSQTSTLGGLQARTDRARKIAALMAERLAGGSRPYTQLLANEFRFVGENHPSHTAHEYLAECNDAYGRAEFLDLVSGYGFKYVADADFNYPFGRLPETLSEELSQLNLDARLHDEVADLLRYRQMHAPILTSAGHHSLLAEVDEWSRLFVASSLVEQKAKHEAQPTFEHASGVSVTAKTDAMAASLRTLQVKWPSPCRVGDLFVDVVEAIEDLRLLHRNGLIELSLLDFSTSPAAAPLNRLERAWGDTTTSAQHDSRAVNTQDARTVNATRTSLD